MKRTLIYDCLKSIFNLGGVVSGHTLKHLAADAGAGCIAAMLKTRASK